MLLNPSDAHLKLKAFINLVFFELCKSPIYAIDLCAKATFGFSQGISQVLLCLHLFFDEVHRFKQVSEIVFHMAAIIPHPAARVACGQFILRKSDIVRRLFDGSAEPFPALPFPASHSRVCFVALQVGILNAKCREFSGLAWYFLI